MNEIRTQPPVSIEFSINHDGKTIAFAIDAGIRKRPIHADGGNPIGDPCPLGSVRRIISYDLTGQPYRVDYELCHDSRTPRQSGFEIRVTVSVIINDDDPGDLSLTTSPVGHDPNDGAIMFCCEPI